MKKIFSYVFALACLLSLNSMAWGFDPMAPASMRNQGMIFIDTPNASDQITLTHLKTGKLEAVKPEKLQLIPAGLYRVEVKMKEGDFSQQVMVLAAERTDVIIPYGNIKVTGPRGAIVQAFDRRDGKLMAQFPANQTKTLPRGPYDIKVLFRGMEASEPNVVVVSNKTRVLKIRS